MRLTVLLMVILLGARSLYGQHVHAGTGTGPFTGTIGAQGVGVVTHASPAMLGRDLTEGYLTQPAVMAMFMSRYVEAQGMLNLEGLTLKRGELNHGVWGEGYIDRRHPHTYLHEAVLTGRLGGQGVRGSGDLGASVSLGRGFAPFGTDDPMVRPFVTYPSNHHLSQILERWIAIGAVRYGPVGFEYGRFNGDEPTGPRSMGEIDRFGDSWSMRGTLWPVRGVEVQGSVARVTSPEIPTGGGLNQHKYNVSARFDGQLFDRSLYGLIEHARTADTHENTDVWVFTSTLVEAATNVGRAKIAARYENSLRPEEERLNNMFRSLRPSTDNSILGETRWRIYSLNASTDVQTGNFRFTPFMEGARAYVRSTNPFSIAQPKAIFGDERIWNISAGVRASVGMKHERMGRYGAAAH